MAQIGGKSGGCQLDEKLKTALALAFRVLVRRTLSPPETQKKPRRINDLRGFCFSTYVPTIKRFALASVGR